MPMQKSWRTVEVMQYCSFGFTKTLVDDVLKNWSVVKDYAYIVHDKDVKKDGTLKDAHIHLMLRFRTPVPTDAILSKFNRIYSKAGGIEEIVIEGQHLQKCKSWKSAVAYLTHANDNSKYQYPDNEVCSNYDWQQDRDDAVRCIKDAHLQTIIDAIECGEITRYNVVDKLRMDEFVRYKKQLDTCFAYRDDKRKFELKEGKIDMKVIYIYGESGTGKTTYAKQYCEDHNLTYCISGGSNDPLQDYNGEQALILDDLRGSSFRFSDFLKLTDHNTRTSVNSRYYNKFLFVSVIIITSTLPVNEFYNQLFEKDGEEKKQVYRRCDEVMRMTKDRCYIMGYDKSQHRYVNLGDFPNVISEKYSQEKMTQDKAMELLQDLASSMKSFGHNVAKIEPTLSDEIREISDKSYGYKQLSLDDVQNVPFLKEGDEK